MGCTKALCKLTPTQTFLEHIVETIQQTDIQNIVVVTGAQAEEIQKQLAHLNVIWIQNQQWQTTHMLESLTCGLKAIPDHHTVIHWPVDCIGITANDLKKLMDAPEAPFAVLANQGIPGHPLRISPENVQKLKSGNHQAQSLREFVDLNTCLKIEAQSDALMNCNDPKTLQNFML